MIHTEAKFFFNRQTVDHVLRVMMCSLALLLDPIVGLRLFQFAADKECGYFFAQSSDDGYGLGRQVSVVCMSAVVDVDAFGVCVLPRGSLFEDG